MWFSTICSIFEILIPWTTSSNHLQIASPITHQTTDYPLTLMLAKSSTQDYLGSQFCLFFFSAYSLCQFSTSLKLNIHRIIISIYLIFFLQRKWLKRMVGIMRNLSLLLPHYLFPLNLLSLRPLPPFKITS